MLTVKQVDLIIECLDDKQRLYQSIMCVNGTLGTHNNAVHELNKIIRYFKDLQDDHLIDELKIKIEYNNHIRHKIDKFRAKGK